MKVRAPVRIDFGGAWTDVGPYADKYGGATLNAALQLYVRGEVLKTDGGRSIHIDSREIPMNSGLGTSAAEDVVFTTLLRAHEFTNGQPDIEARNKVAHAGYLLEKDVMDFITGKQDQYAAAFGGINLFEFLPSGGVIVHPLNLSEETLSKLEQSLVVGYTGIQRLSSKIHEHVWGNYHAENPETIEALEQMKNLAYEQRVLLQYGHLNDFGKTLAKHWEYQKLLHNSVTNPEIDKLMAYADGLGCPGKATGAGGGGCLIWYTPTKEKNSQLVAGLQSEAPKLFPNFRVLSCKIDRQGLTIEEP